MLKFDRLFQLVFFSLFSLELVSFIGFVHPSINLIASIIILLTGLILSLKKLEYGVWMVLAELFIGSKGYLFSISYHNFSLSIRIALWLVVMSVWFGKVLVNLIKTKNLKQSVDSYRKNLTTGNNKYFAGLFLFVIWAGFSGWLNHNQTAFVVDELKRWSYLLFIFPLFTVLKNKTDVQNFMSVFWASIIWLSLKTIFLLFIFSHGMLDLVPTVYRWVRTTGVGEITQVKGGFYRIFIQSQIYNLVGFFIAVFYLLKTTIENKFQALFKSKIFWQYFSLASVMLTITLISFSRSFWVGLAGGLLLTGLVLAYKIRQTFDHSTKTMLIKLAYNGLVLGSVLISSLLIILLFVKFPYPRPVGGFDTTNLFSERATTADESAIGSRWSLLPKLWQKISISPIPGQGYGSTVTYQSQDPRVLATNPNGTYTTYAFEWGWFDIWLKLGLLGLLLYLFLLSKLVQTTFKGIKLNRQPELLLGLAVGIIVLAVVNFFTPYLNHPLGLGYLILASAITTALLAPIAETEIK